jgi:hypothetical protein
LKRFEALRKISITLGHILHACFLCSQGTITRPTILEAPRSAQIQYPHSTQMHSSTSATFRYTIRVANCCSKIVRRSHHRQRPPPRQHKRAQSTLTPPRHQSSLRPTPLPPPTLPLPPIHLLGNYRRLLATWRTILPKLSVPLLSCEERMPRRRSPTRPLKRKMFAFAPHGLVIPVKRQRHFPFGRMT